MQPAVLEQVIQLTEDYRDGCLWFLDARYVPSTEQEALRLLALIERHGDRAAFERTTRLRACLSPASNAKS